jgi:hypothetical protein
MKLEVKIWLVTALLLVGVTVVGVILAVYARKQADSKSQTLMEKVDQNATPTPSFTPGTESTTKVDWNENQ